jgi:hypothetical protein
MISMTSRKMSNVNILLCLDLKKAPYLRADAARRNRRKTQELMKQISRDVLAGVTNGTNMNTNNTPELHL